MSSALTTNVDLKKLRTTKFPREFNDKVDMTKVNNHIIKKWMTDEITRILQNEDDVVTELISNMLEERYPNVKELQIALTGFLDKDAAPFCRELWKLCLSAQQSPQGIPKELLEAKKQELAQSRMEEERAREQARIREDAEREREREMARIREQERHDRQNRRGGRNGRDYDRRPRYASRSPHAAPPPPQQPRRRREDDDFYRGAPPTSRGGDTYRPSGRSGREARPARSPSPMHSRTPTPRRSRPASSPPPAKTSRPSAPRRRKHSETSSADSHSPDRNGRRDNGHGPRNRSGRYASRSPPSKRRRQRSRSSPTPPPRSPRARTSRRDASPQQRRRSYSSHSSSTRSSLSRSRSRSRSHSRSPSSSPDRNDKTSTSARDLMGRSDGEKQRGSLGNGRLSREFSNERSMTGNGVDDGSRSRGRSSSSSGRSRSRSGEREE